MFDLVDQVATRKDFVAFVDALRNDLRDHAVTWESTSLGDYLEALGGYVEDLGPSLEDIVAEHEPPEPVPSWRLFARILLVASIYE